MAPKKGEGFGYRFLVDLIGHQGDECVVWPLWRDKCGRGRVGINGKQYWAHRLMCMLAHGDPPSPKHQAAHECGKGHEGCVNPRHLKWKTQAENNEDCRRHGTLARHWGGNVRRLKPDQIQAIKDAHFVRTQDDLAAEYGVSASTIWDIWHGRSHTRPSKIPHWTPDEELKLREAINLGMNFPQIAARIGTRDSKSVSNKAYRLGLASGQPPHPNRRYRPSASTNGSR